MLDVQDWLCACDDVHGASLHDVVVAEVWMLAGLELVGISRRATPWRGGVWGDVASERSCCTSRAVADGEKIGANDRALSAVLSLCRCTLGVWITELNECMLVPLGDSKYE